MITLDYSSNPISIPKYNTYNELINAIKKVLGIDDNYFKKLYLSFIDEEEQERTRLIAQIFDDFIKQKKLKISIGFIDNLDESTINQINEEIESNLNKFDNININTILEEEKEEKIEEEKEEEKENKKENKKENEEENEEDKENDKILNEGQKEENVQLIIIEDNNKNVINDNKSNNLKNKNTNENEKNKKDKKESNKESNKEKRQRLHKEKKEKKEKKRKEKKSKNNKENQIDEEEKEIGKIIEKSIKSIKNDLLQSILNETSSIQQSSLLASKINENNNKYSNIHLDIKCAGCKECPIVGVRYKCVECKNLNYCEKCEANIDHSHPLYKIKYYAKSISNKNN